MKDDKQLRRQELYELMGKLPDRSRHISASTIAKETRNGYILEKLMLDLNGVEPVPAYFVRPETGTGQLPTVLYNHAHGEDYELGKEELLLGRDGLQAPPYAQDLTSRGYAALCIDAWAFGERPRPHGIRNLQRNDMDRARHVGYDGLRQLAGR